MVGWEHLFVFFNHNWKLLRSFVDIVFFKDVVKIYRYLIIM